MPAKQLPHELLYPLSLRLLFSPPSRFSASRRSVPVDVTQLFHSSLKLFLFRLELLHLLFQAINGVVLFGILAHASEIMCIVTFQLVRFVVLRVV